MFGQVLQTFEKAGMTNHRRDCQAGDIAFPRLRTFMLKKGVDCCGQNPTHWFLAKKTGPGKNINTYLAVQSSTGRPLGPLSSGYSTHGATCTEREGSCRSPDGERWPDSITASGGDRAYFCSGDRSRVFPPIEMIMRLRAEPSRDIDPASMRDGEPDDDLDDRHGVDVNLGAGPHQYALNLPKSRRTLDRSQVVGGRTLRLKSGRTGYSCIPNTGMLSMTGRF